MRITFLAPDRGLVGGVKVLGEYAGRLRARGHEVAVLYRRPAPYTPATSASTTSGSAVRAAPGWRVKVNAVPAWSTVMRSPDS